MEGFYFNEKNQKGDLEHLSELRITGFHITSEEMENTADKSVPFGLMLKDAFLALTGLLFNI